MESSHEVIALSILISSLVVVVLTVFALLFFLLFVKKKKRLHAENVRLKVSFSETLMEAQLEIQEQTMARISTEIHDNIGQVLSLVTLNLHTLRSEETEKLANISGLLGKAIGDLRSLSKSLNSDQIKEMGLVETIKHDVRLLEASRKFVVTLKGTQVPSGLTPDMQLILYRMIQELINNVIRHSGASEIFISLFDKPDQITVRDNGIGFNAAMKTGGAGMSNLKKRAKLLGGDMQIHSTGDGTTVNILLSKL